MAEPLLSSDSSFARVSDASSPRLSSRVALVMVSIAAIAVAGFIIALVFLIGSSVEAEPITTVVSGFGGNAYPRFTTAAVGLAFVALFCFSVLAVMALVCAMLGSAQSKNFTSAQRITLLVVGGTLVVACVVVPVAMSMLTMDLTNKPTSRDATVNRGPYSVTFATPSVNGVVQIVIENRFPFAITARAHVMRGGFKTSHVHVVESWATSVMDQFPAQAFVFDYSAHFGKETNQHSSSQYRFPWDGVFMCTQASNGIDVLLPEGTPIYAARDGIVFETESNVCCNGSVANNHVLIAHNDGTFAYYAHLRLDGVAVAVGSQVSAGQLIGFSGNTGLSTTPRLHFQVQLMDGSASRLTHAVPVRFSGSGCSTKADAAAISVQGRSSSSSETELVEHQKLCNSNPADRFNCDPLFRKMILEDRAALAEAAQLGIKLKEPAKLEEVHGDYEVPKDLFKPLESGLMKQLRENKKDLAAAAAEVAAKTAREAASAAAANAAAKEAEEKARAAGKSEAEIAAQAELARKQEQERQEQAQRDAEAARIRDAPKVKRVGAFLKSPDGRNLYFMKQENPTKIACVGKCRDFWPVAGSTWLPDESAGGVAAATVILRPDGDRQLCVNNRCLYTFINDRASSDDTKGLSNTDFQLA